MLTLNERVTLIARFRRLGAETGQMEHRRPALSVG
jgi:hypothetical protein